MINLSDSQIRDITKLLEQRKPLPDKYRFVLFEDKREVELVWNGKTSEVTNVVLPFQTIEVVDEPRAERTEDTKRQAQMTLFDFDDRGRQIAGWTNKLIWGDNKLILSSLKSGPLRESIENEGGLKLVYIDPPFDVGADFSIDVEIGNEKLNKQPNVLEEIAYRDTWGKGADSWLQMMYERLTLISNLMAIQGSIYVHVDYRVVGFLRLLMDNIFPNFQNQIVWKRSAIATNVNKQFRNSHDYILFYSNSDMPTFNVQYTSYSDSSQKHYNKEDVKGVFRTVPLMASGRTGGVSGQPWRGVDVASRGKNGMHWLKNPNELEKLDSEGLIYWNSNGVPELKYYQSEAKGVYVSDFWDDISVINSMAKESEGYPTQKPEKLLERIIKASSSEGDLVADFFCGSGTTLAVAERLGRKWIGSDLGKFAVHTSRKRLIGLQRELKKSGKDFRAFEILNLGKYERQHYAGVNTNLNSDIQQKILAKKDSDFINLITIAYKAEKVEGFKTFVAKKAGRLIAIGPINLPASRLFVEEIIKECLEKQITKVDILSFEYEMGLFPKIQEEAKDRGIDLSLKHIPREVFDKRAIEKNQIVFHDVSYIEVKPHVIPATKKESAKVAVELTDFSVFYNQDIVDNVIEGLNKGANKVLVEKGNIIKISKDKDGIVSKEILTKEWTDWIDYWAVDFDFESKKEIVRIKNEETGKTGEAWTGDYIFENEWQSFRTKNDRTIELKSIPHECKPGRRKIGVKVVDIFGNDTMKVIEVNI